ncbi:hypothetical protein HAX54_038440, partial [Datura stramonium]|nr:hypothetical protein [Datura stramonium]
SDHDWIYECYSIVDPNISVRVGNFIPRILNLRVVTDHIPYATMMEGIFSRNNNPLTESGFVGVEENTSTNQDDFDDFSSTLLVVRHKRPKQDLGADPTKPLKNSKTEVVHKQTPKKFTIQKRVSPAKQNKQAQSPEKPRIILSNQNHMMPQKKKQSQVEVNNQFIDIRNLINEHFAKVMKALKAKGYFDTEIFDSKGANNEIRTNTLDGSNERKANLKDIEGDIVLETKIDTHHDDVSHMVKDSYTKAGHDSFVMVEVNKILKLLPLYLTLSGFYHDIKDIGRSRDDSYMDKAQSESLNVQFVDNLPQQAHDSMKCGVYVSAYAKYLSNEVDIHASDFEANLHRPRYGALLWDYGSRKIEGGIIRDNES